MTAKTLQNDGPQPGKRSGWALEKKVISGMIEKSTTLDDSLIDYSRQKIQRSKNLFIKVHDSFEKLIFE